MAEPDAILFSDVLDHLSVYTGGAAMDTEQRWIRKATTDAYLRLCNERNWKYLITPGRITFVAPNSTGTVSYDHSGGTYERMLTFSDALSATVQAWAKFGRIRVNGCVHEIEDYKTSTVVTLTARANPGADFTAQTFDMYQSVYPMNADLRRLFPPSSKERWWSYPIGPEEWLSREWHINSSSTAPYRFSILPDPDRAAGWALAVDPRPTAAGFFDYVYQRWPRAMKITGKELNSYTGNVTVTANTKAVTGSGTTFTADMVGSYIRFPAPGAPTTVPDGIGGLNPYYEQKQIAAVASGTALTLSSAVENGYSGAAFCISDPVDISLGMREAMFRCAEWQLAILGRVQNPDEKYTFYRDALNIAFESDSLSETVRQWSSAGAAYLYHEVTPLGSEVGG